MDRIFPEAIIPPLALTFQIVLKMVVLHIYIYMYKTGVCVCAHTRQFISLRFYCR